MSFFDLLKTKSGKVLLSIIWGLGIAIMFKRSCDGRTCYIVEYKGPPPEDVKNNIYNYGGAKCYTYTPYITECKRG